MPWQGFRSKGPTRVGDNVWCGTNVVITSGVTVGERCVIGANSVVNRDLPPYSIAAGAPARVIKRVTYPGAGSLTAWRSGPPGPHEFLMTMPSMMLAARSAASMAASRRSKMSFQRITTIGSIPPSNSEATASRVMRSPSFSSRLTSTV